VCSRLAAVGVGDVPPGRSMDGMGHPRVVGWFSVHAQYRVRFLDRISQNHYWWPVP